MQQQLPKDSANAGLWGILLHNLQLLKDNGNIATGEVAGCRKIRKFCPCILPL